MTHRALARVRQRKRSRHRTFPQTCRRGSTGGTARGFGRAYASRCAQGCKTRRHSGRVDNLPPTAAAPNASSLCTQERPAPLGVTRGGIRKRPSTTGVPCASDRVSAPKKVRDSCTSTIFAPSRCALHGSSNHTENHACAGSLQWQPLPPPWGLALRRAAASWVASPWFVEMAARALPPRTG